MVKKSAISKANKLHSSKQRDAQKPVRKKVSDILKSPGRKIQEKKLTKGRKQTAEGLKKMGGDNKPRSGCFPQFLMVLVPFTAVAAYLLLGL